MSKAPELILEAVLRGELSGQFSSGVLMADITGFTGRFQKMAAEGTRGAEKLSREVNSTLSSVVSVLSGFGGYPVAFAGDAVTAVFPDGFERAEQARERLLSLSGSDFLPISCFAAHGPISWTVIPMDGWSFYSFQGSALRLAASGGGIVEGPVVELSDTSHVSGPVAAVFQPPELFREEIPGQFRHVTSVFISQENRQGWNCPVEFQQLVLQAAESTGGFVSGLETSGTAYSMLTVFGAPVGREDDHRRADRFLEYVFNGAQGRVKAGASSGLVFSGTISTPLLESYTVLGPSVNLAARLHDAAGWNRVYACSDFNSTSMLKQRRLRQLELKGFSQTVTVHQLHPWGRRQVSSFSDSPLLGRGELLEEVKDELVRPGGMVLLQGETGMGKTRMVEELRARMADTSFVHLKCRSTSEFSSGDVFARWLREWFGNGDEASFREKLYSFVDTLEDLDDPAASASADELLRAESVLAALVGFQRERSLYSGLSPQGRFENTVSVVAAFISGFMAAGETVLVVDDLQNIDPDSMELLSGVLTHPLLVPPSMLLLSSDADPVLEGFEPVILTVPPLSERDVAEFLKWKLGAAPSRQLTQWFFRRTEGIPFYMEQYAGLLESPDSVPPEESFPGSLHSLLVARLDNLAPELRSLVLSASVLGREFDVRVLDGLVAHAAPDKLLQEGEKLGIWVSFEPWSYSFSHNLLREAALRLQSHSARSKLHLKAAKTMVTLWPGDLSRASSTARHYELGDDPAMASQWYLKAGHHALSRRMKDSCRLCFSRVLELSCESHERIDAWRQLYELHTTSGEYVQAAAVIDRAMEDQTVSCHRSGVIRLLQANLAVNMGTPEKAADILEEMGTQDPDLKADVLHLQGRILMLAGKTGEARDHLLGLYQEFSNGSSQQRELAHRALGNAAGCMLRTQTDLPEAEKALKTVQEYGVETGNLMMETIAVGNLAILYRYMGRRTEDSGRMIRRHLELARLTGSHLAELQALGNLASHLERESSTDEVFSLYHQAIALSEKFGGEDSLSISIANLAVAYSRVGKLQESIEYFEKALEICRKSSLGVYVKEYLFELAGIQVDAGELESASKNLLRLQGLDEEEEEYLQQRYLIQGRILAARGDRDQAEADLRRSYEICEQAHDRFDAAYSLALLTGKREDTLEAIRCCEAILEESPHWHLKKRLAELKAIL